MPCHFFRESSYWWSMLRTRSRDVDGHNSREVGMPTRSRSLLRGCGSGSGVYPFLEAGRRRPAEKKCRTANNNGSAAEDEAAARDCRAAPRAMSMQKDPIQALVAGSEGARIWKSLTMPNRFAGVCGPQVTSGPSLPSQHRSESTKFMRFQ